MNEWNDCADAVLESPDRHVLTQEQLFEAKGSWATCAATIGFGLAGVAAVLATNGRIGAHLGRGNLKFREWLQITAAFGLCAQAGEECGIKVFGNEKAFWAHEYAYTLIKNQNRYNQKNQLMKAPMFF